MENTQLIAIDILTGFKSYSVSQFLDEVGLLYDYKNSALLGKKFYDEKFDKFILCMAYETDYDSLFLEYDKNKISEAELFKSEETNFVQEMKQCGNIRAFEVYNCLFKLFALFMKMKTNQNFENLESDNNEEEIISRFTISYMAFLEDWKLTTEKLALKNQSEETQNLKL
jgi:hypothetical protein